MHLSIRDFQRRKKNMDSFSKDHPIPNFGTPANSEARPQEDPPYIGTEYNQANMESDVGFRNPPVSAVQALGSSVPETTPRKERQCLEEPSEGTERLGYMQGSKRDEAVPLDQEKINSSELMVVNTSDLEKTVDQAQCSVVEKNQLAEGEKNFLSREQFGEKMKEIETDVGQVPKIDTYNLYEYPVPVLPDTSIKDESGQTQSDDTKPMSLNQPSDQQKSQEPDHMKDLEPFLNLSTTSQERLAISTLLEVSQTFAIPQPLEASRKPDEDGEKSNGEAQPENEVGKKESESSGPVVDSVNSHPEDENVNEKAPALETSADSQYDTSMDVTGESELGANDHEESEDAVKTDENHEDKDSTTVEPSLLVSEASPKVKLEVSKALETVCRQVLLADKFIYITGDLRFCIDDKSLLKMTVNHNINNPSGRVFRNRRSRKNFSPVKKKPVLYEDDLSNDTIGDIEPSGEELIQKIHNDLKEVAETPPKRKQLHHCDKCSYVTKHLGFFKKHQRTKHSPLSETAAVEKPLVQTVKRKRGRPRKTPKPPPVESDIEPEFEPEPLSDIDAEQDEYIPERSSDITDGDTEASQMKTRSATTPSSGKHKCDECFYSTDHSGHFKEHLNKHKGLRPFACTICVKSYTRQDDLLRHLEVHNRKYECTMCATEFPERSLLKEHMKQAHNEVGRLQLFPCDVCKKNLPTHTDLEKHVEAKHNHICSNCGETFTHIARLKKHKNEQHPNEALTCTICMKVCASRGALRKHMHRHRAGNKFPCDICGRTFTAQSTLYHHKRGVHSNLKPYECDQCEKRFNFHHSLKLHVLQHKGERPYKCDICEKTYLTATHLKSHKQAVHEEKKKYLCVICNKRFPYENSLKMHMMLHTGDRPFLCNICGRGFVNHSALKTHEASHVDSKQWECEICKKMYKTEALLRAHRRRHTGEGSRFMCDICGHTFMYKSNLEAHYTVHSNERKYTCKECHATFKTAATLYSHRLVHSTETPHSCSVCSKAFKSKERKIAHERRHLGDKPFQCEVCGRSFPDKGGLTKHCKTVHAKTKKFSCPVCKKTCSRADNLRVHMRIHRDPTLLKMDWKSLMTDDVDEADMDLGFDHDQMSGGALNNDDHTGQQHGGGHTGNVPSIMNTVTTAQSDVSNMVINTSTSTVHHHMSVQPHDHHHSHSNDLRHPTSSDMAQPNDLRQPTDLRQHHNRVPGHHHASSHMHGVLVVPDPNLPPHHHHPHHHTMTHVAGGAGVQQHHLTSVSSQVLQPPHTLPAPPPAHHQQPNHLQAQDYDTLGPMPQDSLRAIQVVMPPAAHSSTDDGSQSLQAPMSHHMRDYAEVANAMLFMQYQNLQNSHQQ